MSATPEIFSIGHSNHSFEAFVGLLRQHAVNAVADVRSTPYSRRHPQFNHKKLQEALAQSGIDYMSLGAELGARPKDESCYERGRVQYARLAARSEFRQGIERLLAEGRSRRVAMMCAEKEPLDCHRTLLVAPALEAAGARVAHIKSDGGLESHRQAMLRLLDTLGMPREDLFRSEETLIREALARQEAKAAYSIGRMSR